MIWLFDDSLFRKSVSAPYVSNMRRARYLDALPWALWKASAVLQPGGRIDLWTQTCIPHGAKAHRTGFKCTFKETLSQSFASYVLSSLFIYFFYYELIVLLKATSAVFEYLSLRKPAKSSGIKPREASLSLFPLLSPGSTLVMIIGSPVFYLAGISKQDNASRLRLEPALQPVSHHSNWLISWPDWMTSMASRQAGTVCPCHYLGLWAN